MYEKLVDLSEKSKQSSTMIVSQTKVIQFNTEDMNEYKKKRVKDLEIQNDHLRKNCALKERIREQERYRMR